MPRRRAPLTIALAAVGALAPAQEREPPRLACRLELALGGKPEGVLALDLDDDGRDELIAATKNPGALWVWTDLPSAWDLAPSPRRIPIGDYPLGPVASPGADGPRVAVASRSTLELSALDPLGRSAPKSIALATRPRALAAGDLGADGRSEVVAVDADGLVTIWDGAGESRQVATGAGGVSCAHVLRDGNGIALGCQDELRVLVFRGRPEAPWELAPAEVLELDGIPRAIAELERSDGRAPDLLVAGGERSLWIFDAGAGGAPRAVARTGAIPLRLDLADLTGDGRRELLLLNYYDLSFHVLAGAGGAALLEEYAGQTPWDLAAGDFDGDGRADLAFANTDAQRVGLVFSGRDGPRLARRVATGRAPHSVALGDLDGDGRAEALALNSLEGTLSVLPWRDGALRSGGSLPSGPGADHVRAADLDRDGRLDAAWTVRDAGGARLVAAFGDGRGGLAPRAGGAPIALGASADDLLLGDFDGDGALEALAADGEGGRLAWIGLGAAADGGLAPGRRAELLLPAAPRALAHCAVAGGRQVAVAIGTRPERAGVVLVTAAPGADGEPALRLDASLPVATVPIDLVAADLDGDGRDDLALLGRRAPGEPAGQVHVLLQRDGGEWERLEVLETGQRPFGIAAGDLDGDGRAEILVGAQNSHHVNLWRARAGPPPRFERTADLGAGLGCLAVALFDLDGDGALEIVVANGGSDDLSVISGR